ncbi:dihydrofolate reductase [Porphyromonas canoris]|uniref:Dihydrofolate reductase n=1 Tax=Porphyromonas canoris TaxID=36875 RepID=A0ABR4XK43_9PORP|nr:dihydrofolate reductase [Porphyromonas canoris]KGN92044.1 hypothetical protein HQ43_08345 [Porphyromonas canoris]
MKNEHSPLVSMIVAMGLNREIGQQGDMPWGRSLRADLAFFKQTTLGHPIIMGRKTFESLPNGALPGRRNIILTRSKDYTAPSCEIVHSIEEAISVCKDEKELFFIGGADIFKQAFPLTDTLYITEVDATFDQADTFMPPLSDEWTEVSAVHHPKDDKNHYNITFRKFLRKQ